MENPKNDMEVKAEEIHSLLEYFSKNTYKARDSHPMVQQVMRRCLQLFGLDYNYSVISNTYGELSTNYPSNLVILESNKGEPCNDDVGTNGNGVGPEHSNGDLFEVSFSKERSPLRETQGGVDLHLESESFIGSNLPIYGITPTSSNGVNDGNGAHNSVRGSNVQGNKIQTMNDSNSDASKIKDICSRARFARCRARFPVSVILYKKTHICRSATLSGGPEIYGRSSFDYFFSGGADRQYSDPDAGADDEIVVPETQSDWQLFDRVRSQDIRLLKSFRVHTIVDLMVEKKKVKFGVNVTSSEKVDKENRYSEFNLISLPYPGCEFFKEYREKGYNAEDLIFQWNQGHVDANIFVPADPTTIQLNTDWAEYRKWDLVTLTQKYLKLLLAYVKSGKNGLLVHCISGWDRTPLFVSLLRLSLWADGAIHQSLSPEQILYLTLAYDWLLFGHNLEDRLSKGEEILFFCFYFLKYMVDVEYSVENSEPSTSANSNRTEAPASKPEPVRTRNNSDIQLDGVLFEGDVSHTSPDGSNWSLSSLESSQSSRSQDNPPSYFQVTQGGSWEDFKDAFGRQRHASSNSNHIAQPANNYIPSATTSNQNTSDILLESVVRTSLNKIKFEPESGMVNTPLQMNGNHAHNADIDKPYDSAVVAVNGVAVSPTFPTSSEVKVHSINSSSPSIPKNWSSAVSGFKSAQEGDNGVYNLSPNIPRARTSPVAVPTPNRGSHRPESSSSASIGSWQLVTGPSSFKDAISSSDPGSNSSHSHSHKVVQPHGIPDCPEVSESSCTLIEELIPPRITASVETIMTDSVVAITETLREIPDMDEVQSTSSSQWQAFETADEISAIVDNMKDSIYVTPLVPNGAGATDATPTNTTPTKEKDDLFCSRREKLQTVRALFYTLYAAAIGFKFRSVNDNASATGGGLSFLIGNLLGSAKTGSKNLNRTTNV